jgi:hypothetical protein
MLLKFKKISALLAGATLLIATNAMAIPISGSIGYGGNWARSGNTIDFLGTPTVETVSGDLASFISLNNMTAFNDLTFNPFVSPHNLWSLGGFSFALQTVNTVFDNGKQFIILQGTGLLSGNGFSNTLTDWDLSTNKLTFSTSNVTQEVSVSEPTSMMLLSIGMLGLVGVQRKKLF